MLSIALYLLTHAMLLSLHLSGGSFPRPLSAQEEKKYVERMLAGDIEARNVLVEHNLRLVAHIAKKYYTQSDEQDDLISIGTIGLIKAVETFCPDKKIKLATYASRCIENEILMVLRKNAQLRGEISIDEPLSSDWDGNELLLSDILGTESDLVMKPIEADVDRQLLRQAMEQLRRRMERRAPSKRK